MTGGLVFLAAAGMAMAGAAFAQEPTAESVRKLLDTGKYADAEIAARQLLAHAESATGPASRETAEALSLLLPAVVQNGKFNSPEVLEIARRTIAIREAVFGLNHPDVAAGLNNLGGLLVRLGRDDEARPALEKALAIYEHTADRNSLKAFAAWSNLAWVLTNLGDYPEADRSYARALTIAELHSDIGRIADALDGQAVNFRHMRDYPRARANYERALELYEKQFGPTNERIAGSLNNLGHLFLVMREPRRAIPLLQRALAICDNAFGPDSYRAADMLAGLGMAQANMGAFAESRLLLEHAVQIRRKFESGSDKLAGTLTELASLQARTGDFAASLEASLDAESIGRRNLELTARILPERQALAYASARVMGLDTALSLVAAEAPVSIRMVADALIRSRAVVFDEMAARHRVLSDSRDSQTAIEIARLVRELGEARERLSSLVVEGTDRPQLLEDASHRKELAEKALAEKSVSFRQELASRRAGLAEVAASLEPGSAMVSFVLYKRSPAEQVPSGKIFEVDAVPSYMALVLRGPASEPVAVPIGPSKEIDSLVAAVRKQVASEAMAPGESLKRSEAAYFAAAEALRRRIWDPLAAAIGPAKTVFVTPDGLLHLVNFAALPVHRSQYLIEKGPLIHYLSSERDLLPVAVPVTGEGLLVLGDPAFSAGAPYLAGSKQLYRGNPSTCPTFRSMQFEPLPGTAREAGEIAALWRRAGNLGEIREFRGAAASEGAFKREVSGRRVVHLATHGFFLGDCPSALDDAAVRGENPLLLSGLAFAGANLRRRGGLRDEAAPREEDGILTAEEIAAMDLTGVEWAVLSACETGVGELKAGEGVFGLRRAFQVAGVRTVLMSLWPVEDQSTRQWMTALYTQRFLKGRSTAESVRAASLEVLRKLRTAGRSTHPFYWGGFVAAGDWK